MKIRHLLAMTSLLLLARPVLAHAPVDARKASLCGEIAACSYFHDVYAGDKYFRDALRKAFRESGLKQPRWVARGVNTPMIPLRQGNTLYLRGTVCEPHNCPHQLTVLYRPDTHALQARYAREDGSNLLLGQPDAQQQALLREESDPASPLAGKLNDNSALPLSLP